MSGKTSIKGFSGGMNQDTDFSLLKDNQYYDALNYKLIADQDSNGFTLENAEGNISWLDITTYFGYEYKIVGHCYINPYLVVFATTNVNDKYPSGGVSSIMRIRVDKDELQDIQVIYTDSATDGTLNFSDTYPISAVGYYEAPENIKVYWTDNYSSVRTINIMDTNLSSYATGMLDLVPDFPIDSTVDIRPNTLELTTGSLKACSVQYTYQYFIDNGAQTLWAPLSPLQVIPVKEGFTYLYDQEGGEKDEETGYGVKFNIDIPSNNLYSNIRVAAVQYNTLDAPPDVRVIKEIVIETETAISLSVIDSGDLITELLYTEIAIANTVTYKAKTLEIKDNHLFLGNITENLFDVDFDARAYRHDSNGLARLYSSDLSSFITVEDGTGVGYLDFTDVPSTHDCINLFNNPDNESVLEYQYQSDGITFGAEGENVKISFNVSETVKLDTSLTSSTGTTNISVSGTADDLYEAGKKSFHRQEVYRVGIIFKNNKLQSSPVKWVCDVKMPTYTDSSSAFAHVEDTPSTDIDAILLGLTVEVTSALPTGVIGWEIVYVARDYDDRGVLGQGIIQPSLDLGSSYTPTPSMSGEYTNSAVTNIDYNNVTWFESPEISFNKNLKYKDGDFYNKVGYFTLGTAGTSSTFDDTTNNSYFHYKVYTFDVEGGYSTNYYKDIDAAKVIGYTTDENTRIILDGETVKPYIDDGVNQGPNTTTLAVENGTFHADFIGTTIGSATYVPIANYRRNVFQTQFGGLSYYDRQRNEYIVASDIKLTNGATTTWEGDTVIDYFHYTKRCIDIPLAISGNGTAGSTHLFPVETSILTRMSNSPYLYRHLGSSKHRLVQEISGTWEGEIPVTGPDSYTYDQEYELYRYNSVYSQLPKTVVAIADSDSFDDNSTYETRILSSTKKTNNETLDSFTNFKTNNFIDLDGGKGSLNNLLVYKNQLFFWQNSAFGIASVNTRSLIQDGNASLLALGTGGVLDRYDYLSDSIGNQSQFGIAKSRTALYWGDTNKNELFKFDESLKSLSKIKGIQTFINKNGRIGEIKAMFDHKYNDIIFTITFARIITAEQLAGGYAYTFSMDSSTGLDTSEEYNCIVNATYAVGAVNPTRNSISYVSSTPPLWTLELGPKATGYYNYYVSIDNDPTETRTVTFNEIADGWVSRNSFTPGKYIQLDTNFLSTEDYTELYKHNDDAANRCQYYGVTYDSEFTTIFNKEYPYTKVWDAIRWHSESVDSDNVNQFKDTFDTMTIYNDYQTTGDRDLYFKGGTAPATRPTEIGRRDRTWSMQVPRDIIGGTDTDVSDNPDITDTDNWDETQQFKERIRSKWIAVNVTYDNTDNNTYSIPFISSVYRNSVR